MGAPWSLANIGELKNKMPGMKYPSQKPSYLELQAYVGTTKHMGGLDSTRELVAMCHIQPGYLVLDVGCGVGATASHLAWQQGVRVTGVDISLPMVVQAKARAHRDGVTGQANFCVADARQLPFADGQFDALICESVTTFIQDRPGAIAEYVRVTRPAGWAGLNEETWLKPPPVEIAAAAHRTWGIPGKVPNAQGWMDLLASCGLVEIEARLYPFSPRREFSQIRRYGLRDYLKMTWRSLYLYLTSPQFREYMRERRSLPMEVFDYLGYGLYAGRKG
jgi:SAM-dependent methyltransferase